MFKARPWFFNANKKEIRKGMLSLNLQGYFKNVPLKMLTPHENATNWLELKYTFVWLTFQFYLVASFIAKGAPFEIQTSFWKFLEEMVY